MKHLFLFTLLLFTLSTQNVLAKSTPIYTSMMNNLAVGGYDAVSFFQDTPTKGSEDYSYTYNETEWLFSSASNRDLFIQNPKAYAPQYGGHCAWAIGAKSQLVKGSPKHWKIVEGKLYLNYNAAVQETWKQDIPGFITTANQNWPNL